MFIAGDHLVLLREDPDCVWASCEGVVGWVKRGEVQFDQVAGSSSPRISLDTPARDDLPRTVLTAPSPPPIITELANDNRTLAAPKHASRRISSPFEFESPQQSPNIEQSDQQFFDQPEVKGPGIDEKRESVASIASSEVLGGIGGFMMDDSASEGDASEGVEELQGWFLGVRADHRRFACDSIGRDTGIAPSFAFTQHTRIVEILIRKRV